MYYIEDNKNGKIILFDSDIERLRTTLKFIPELKDEVEIKEVQPGYTIIHGQIITDEEAAEINRQARQDMIDHLTMTALDLITSVKTLGVTDEQIEQFLNSNLNLKHQLMFCQNVYCGVVKAFCPIEVAGVTLTAEQIEQLFKVKNGVVD